jgi:serine/threonine protein kinase
MSSSIPQDPLLGQTIDNRYRILKLVARGGMAKVYQAEQIHLSRTVAIKVLDPKHVGADDPEFQKRFELEAQMTSQLNHPNTVTIHDYGFNAQKHFYYFVMEYITGKTLRRTMKEDNAFTIERTLHIAIQIARSVRQAHSVGVIHRDLKPSNILLTMHDKDDNYVKVVDFGLLKLKKESGFEGEKTEGTLMGSPRYMSPEQIKRLPVDHRSDIYSLGVNMYQMLTGKPPFTGSSAVQILMGHLNQPPQAFSKVNAQARIPKDVENFVMSCLEKDPDRRPDDMDEVIETVSALQSSGKKAGAYTSVPVSGQFEVIQSTRAAGRISEEKERAVDDAPSQPSAPPAWSDTLTESPFYEPIAFDGMSPVIPIDIEHPVSRRKFSPALLVIFGLAVIFLGTMVTLGILLFGPGWMKKNADHKAASKQGPVELVTEDAAAAGEAVTATEGKVRIFKLAFSTEPAGAHIFEGDSLLCVTPCDVEWSAPEGEKDKTRKFSVVKEGFEPVEISQKTPDSDVSIGIPLTPIDTGATKKPKGTSGKAKEAKEGKEKKTEEKETKTKEKGKDSGGLKLIQDYPDL